MDELVCRCKAQTLIDAQRQRLILLDGRLLVEDAVDVVVELLCADVALTVLEVVTLDAFTAREVVHAGEALFAMEVTAVFALILVHGVVLRFALLLTKTVEGWQEEGRADNCCEKTQSDQVLNPDVRLELDALLNIDARVLVKPLRHELEEYVAHMDYRYVEDCLVKHVRWLVQQILIVVVEHEERHLVQK